MEHVAAALLIRGVLVELSTAFALLSGMFSAMSPRRYA